MFPAYACETQAKFVASKPNDYGFDKDEDDDNAAYSIVEVSLNLFINGDDSYPGKTTGVWQHGMDTNFIGDASATAVSTQVREAKVSVSQTQFSHRVRVSNKDAVVSTRGDIFAEAWGQTIHARAAVKVGGGFEFQGANEEEGVFSGVALETEEKDVGTIGVGFGGTFSTNISYQLGHTEQEEWGEANIEDYGIIPAGTDYVYKFTAFDMKTHVLGQHSSGPKNAVGQTRAIIGGGEEPFDGGQLNLHLATHCE